MPNWHFKRLGGKGGRKSQVANTWTKITARFGYELVWNGKEPENP